MRAWVAKGLFMALSIMLAISLLAQHGCSGERQKRAVYLLVNNSATHSEQFDKVLDVTRYLLGTLLPGESLGLARIDGESFNETDIVARMTFDLRPSMANAQKRAFLESMQKLGNNIRPGRYTDITGGILQAIEYLNDTRASQKYILIFSDLKEVTRKGKVRDFPISFNGIHVVVINASKLKSDNIDPAEYQQRVDNWVKRVEQGRGTWKLLNDLNYLHTILE